MHLDELDTPVVVVDLDILERNLGRLQSYCQARQIVLRPHVKTHKIPEIAQLQIAAGATGVTVAKVSEARVMADAGIHDLFIAYPLVTSIKARALAELATQTRISAAADSSEGVACLGHAAAAQGVTVGLLVEADVGFHRCGVQSPAAAVALARQALNTAGLDFRGLMFYPGHLLRPHAEQTPLIDDLNARLETYYAAFDQAAIPLAVVSGGSTPTAYRSHELRGVTEIRPGMYALYDRNMTAIGACAAADCALSVLVTVVSTAVPGRAIVDGGSKTFSSDPLLAGDRSGHGVILRDPDARVVALSEEHGHLDISRSQTMYRVGDRIAIVPNHVCPTINLHDRVVAHRGGEVAHVWQVAARGAVR